MNHDQHPQGDTDAVNREVGSNVHALMTKRGVKGVEVANLLKIEPQSLSARLHGRTPFRAHELVIVATRLDVEPGHFFEKFPLSTEMERFEIIDGGGETDTQPSLPFHQLTTVT